VLLSDEIQIAGLEHLIEFIPEHAGEGTIGKNYAVLSQNKETVVDIFDKSFVLLPGLGDLTSPGLDLMFEDVVMVAQEIFVDALKIF